MNLEEILTQSIKEKHFQIDYLPVGDKSKGGDAITLRFGNLEGPRHEQIVMVIDGGTKESGTAIVSNIRNNYGTDSVDVVVATHPDSDHVSGLTEVLNDLAVSELWMHQPWEQSGDLQAALNGTIPSDTRVNYVQASLGQAENLAKIAREKGIPISSPYAGASAFEGMIQILGPSEIYYKELVPQFRNGPESVGQTLANLFTNAVDFVKDEVNKVRETMDVETLKDGNEHFSAENNTSVIMLLTVDDCKILFTGDADADALTLAADYAEDTLGIAMSDLHLLHVPHHGSKQNVGPTILNRIKASKAQISAPVESTKHPHQSVINALIRRGTTVYSTQGKQILHHTNGAGRDGWSPTSELAFVEEFED